MGGSSVKYSITTYNNTAGDVIPMARAAEDAGFDGIWVGEHYICPQDFISEHPTGNPNEENPAKWIVGSDIRLHDPWFLLGAIAGATTRLKIGTAILIVPLNHPLLLARSILTAQEISGGRLLFGTGAGWLKEEFNALEIPFRTRASRYDEMLDIMRRALAGGYFAHEGQHFNFPGVQLTPHPVDVPFILGGNTEVALRRVARKADAWLNSAMIELEDAVRLRERLEALRREHGTADRPFSYYVRPPRAERDEVDRFVAEGFENIVLWGPQVWPNDPNISLADKQAQLKRVADELEIAGSPVGA